MTYGRLLYELDTYGHGEVADQIAYDELEAEANTRRREQAKRASEVLQQQRGRR